ncbi:MAG: serine/threonine-protein phosphatase [Micromonosporaceae bacterium]|jgi:protein phosphatase|nr:serine/threonine-protein phosphatase [Micromonosporaceae bacterium]
MSLTLRTAVVSDPGMVRTNNEDSAHAGERLLAVADGVGGMPAGELASDIVIRVLTPLDSATDLDEPLRALRDALDEANRQIRAACEADPATEGMGTTITALLLLRDQTGADTGMMALLHVGDSRAYLLRGGELRQLTKDDTFVQSLVDQGLITADEARNHPQRSLITRAVQGQHVAPTTRMLPVQAGDRYLLCSDGLSDVVTDEAIGQAMQSYPDLRQCAEQLVKLALQAGAPDNVTAVLADVRAADD